MPSGRRHHTLSIPRIYLRWPKLGRITGFAVHVVDALHLDLRRITHRLNDLYVVSQLGWHRLCYTVGVAGLWIHKYGAMEDLEAGAAMQMMDLPALGR